MAYTIEEICFEIIDILGDNLPAKLDELEIEYTSISLTLDDINRIYFGDIIEAPDMQNMPAISVVGRGYNVEPAGLGNTNREKSRIEIECYISSDINASLTVDDRTYSFSEILEIKIMRYIRAIREALYDHRTLNDKCEYIMITDVILSNVIQNEGEFLRACRLNLEVLHTRR